MLFNSFEFFCFFLIVFVAYWLLFQSRVWARNVFLIAASYLFYGWWDYRFLGLIFLSSAVDYCVAIAMPRAGASRRRALLWTSLGVNLGCLGLFKYYGFFISSLSVLLGEFGIVLDEPTRHLILPVGISFYTLQTLSYTIDVYRRRIEPTTDVAAFFAYVCFFPQLVAGPIERASHLLPQFESLRVFDYQTARDGLRLVLWGMFKKVVIADQCAAFADPVFASLGDQSASTLLLATFYFSLQIYCDFSGYSDMAIGLGRMLGFDLMKNFNRPYFATSMTAFWGRWHISLSTWFRDYLYIPLGGNRGSRWQTLRNLFVVFSVSGLWHGAAWNYVLWGWIHFAYLVPGQFLRGWTPNRESRLSQALGLLRIPVVFCLVTYAWIFFRVPGGEDAIHAALSVFDWSLLTKPDCSRVGLLWAVVLFTAEWLQGSRDHPLQIDGLPLVIRWLLYGLLLTLCLGYFREDSPFLYFQF